MASIETSRRAVSQARALERPAPSRHVTQIICTARRAPQVRIPLTAAAGRRCRAEPHRPGERGSPSPPGPCASSPAVLGDAPLLLVPGAWGAAAHSSERVPAGEGGIGSERDLGSALAWPRPPIGPPALRPGSTMRLQVFGVKERRTNGGVSGITWGSPARKLQTVHPALCGLLLARHPLIRAEAEESRVGNGEGPPFCALWDLQAASESQDLVGAEPL